MPRRRYLGVDGTNTLATLPVSLKLREGRRMGVKPKRNGESRQSSPYLKDKDPEVERTNAGGKTKLRIVRIRETRLHASNETTV